MTIAGWRCPVCSDRLTERTDGRSWSCANGHSYDVAKEGYVNLLITHQRRKRDPGDSADMIRDRRTFLDGGSYQPLRDVLQRFAPDGIGTAAALDAGCGEGYYTRGWPNLWGIDISKPAVRLAARRRSAANERYAVASVYDIPMADESIGVVVSVFAPLHSPEFERVLAPGGRVVTVTPGPDHLAGLAAELFDEVEPHPAGGPFEREGATTALEPLDGHRIRFDLTLDDPTAIAALLGMTPYAWYVGEDVRRRVATLPSLTTPVDFQVSVYGR